MNIVIADLNRGQASLDALIEKLSKKDDRINPVIADLDRGRASLDALIRGLES